MQTSLSFWGRMVAARILHKVNARTAPRRGNLPLQEICVLVEQTATDEGKLTHLSTKRRRKASNDAID